MRYSAGSVRVGIGIDRILIAIGDLQLQILGIYGFLGMYYKWL